MRNSVILRREKNIGDIGLIAKWENDLELGSYFLPKYRGNRDFEGVEKIEIIKNMGKYSKTIYMVEYDEKTIGYASYDTGLNAADEVEKSAWVNIVLGDKSYMNKGIEEIVVLEIERELGRRGVNRLEFN